MKILLPIVLLIVMHARASVEWEQKEIKLEVLPAQVSDRAIFRFSNTGDEPVSIQDIKASCGCLAPKLEKQAYAPGEKGEVEIIFNLQGRTGKQRKDVVVKTSDGEQCKLTLEVDIPKTYTVEPLLLKWKKDGGVRTKSVRLVNQNKTPIILTSVKSSDENISAELKPIREGFEYEVVVTRSKTDHIIRAVVGIETKPPPGLDKSQTIQFYVLAP